MKTMTMFLQKESQLELINYMNSVTFLSDDDNNDICVQIDNSDITHMSHLKKVITKKLHAS